MSTRCQIEFKQIVTQASQVIEESRRTLYQHGNGQPTGKHGVIAHMGQFFEWEMDGRMFDIEYTPANYIYWSKRQDIRNLQALSPDYDEQKAENMTGRLGYGICDNDEFHSDIAFFYEVALTRKLAGPHCYSDLIVQPYKVRPHCVDDILTRDSFKPLEKHVIWENHHEHC